MCIALVSCSVTVSEDTMSYSILFFSMSLKCIAQSLRNGGPQELRLERFVEAIYDPHAMLSYHALAGTRKQSVSDVVQGRLCLH